MRLIGTMGLALFVGGLIGPAALADGNVNFTLGERALRDDASWSSFAGDLDNQPTFGVDFDFGEPDWPVRLCAAIHGSGESDDNLGQEVDAGILDLSFGVRWIANRRGRTHFFLGGGVTQVFATLDSNNTFFASDSDTDQSFGLYANAGVYWNLGPRVNIGFDARTLRGTDLTLREPATALLVDTDADYTQFSMLVGFGWGGGSSRRQAGDQPVR